MMKFTYKILIACLAVSLAGCNKLLDRPPLTSETDETAWTSEEKLRLYGNKYYTDFFPGYGTGFSTGGAPLINYTNSDDVLVLGNAPNFTRAVSTGGIWSYSLIRSINIMIDRIDTQMTDVLTTEQKNHWLGVGRFWRAWRYATLVTTYGDIPYYDYVVTDTDEEALYKPRDPRATVMDAVYDDLRFALENVRLNDGSLALNRYVVAGVISRLALFEGTWQKYYYENPERARKFLDLAVIAGDLVINSGRYDIVTDYKSLFASADLSGNPDVILHRAYDPAVGVTHSVASNANLEASTINGPTTDLIKSYLATDGNVWQNSTIPDANKFDLANLIQTRDPRFEATFYSKPEPLNRASFYYVTKFLPRSVEQRIKVDSLSMPSEFSSDRNETDYPVLRYAEVLLNWIEAKAEFASLGGTAVSQSDIDRSINKIRQRPLAEEASDRGVKKVANMDLGNLPNDPNRDPEVSALLWEIRRERRAEFTFEYSRLEDLKRWKKLDYLENIDENQDLLSGGWVNFPAEMPDRLNAANVGVLSVVDLNGVQKIYNGTNGSEMIGFFRSTANNGRLPFLNLFNVNPYLAPIGTSEIDRYNAKGYELQQTEGWPQN